MEDGFGKPKHGGGDKQFEKYFKLTKPLPGESTILELRILPPMKQCAETGDWAKYHRIHYGFSGRSTKAEGKLRLRPFHCIEDKNRKTGIVKQKCPACEMIYKRETQMKQAEAQALKDGKDKEEIKILLAPFQKFLSDFNVDSKWHLNAINTNGEAGKLKISHRLKLKLDVLIRETIEKEGFDPIDLNDGVFLKFKRVGSGRETQDDVNISTILEKTSDGKRFEEFKKAPISAEQGKSVLRICSDLRDCNIPRLTEDQIARLVQSGNDPDVVDRVFGASVRREMPEVEEHDGPDNDEPTPEPVKVTKPAEAAPKAEVKAEDDEEAQLMKQLAEARAKKAAKPKTQELPPVPAHLTDSDSISDEEFMAMYGPSSKAG